MAKQRIQAPKHLKAATKKWWLSVVKTWDLEGHHLKILTTAAEAWDRAVQAREAIEELGLTYNDRFGQPHARPEVAVERDASVRFMRAVRELNLDGDASDPSRPPRTGGRRW